MADEGGEEARSGTSTPRLRLTLKLSEPRTPAADGSEGKTPEPAPAPGDRPAVARRQTKRPSRAVQPLAAEPAFAPPVRKAAARAVPLAPASPGRARPGPSTFVGRMRAFRPRPWRLAAVAVGVLPPGQPFSVPCWTRPDTAPAAPRVAVAPAPSTGAAQMSVGASAPQKAGGGVSSRHLTGDGPWPCPQPGCAKAFDTKLKWRRHQAVHNKRLAKLSAAPRPE